MEVVAQRGPTLLIRLNGDGNGDAVLVNGDSASAILHEQSAYAMGYWNDPEPEAARAAIEVTARLLEGDRLTAAGMYVEAQHPRHPRGHPEGGQWRKGGPVLDDAHVYPEIDEFVNGQESWIGAEGLDEEKAFILSRYHNEYGPPLASLMERLDEFPDAVIQPQVDLDLLNSETGHATGFIDVLLRNGADDQPFIRVVSDGRGGLEIQNATSLDDGRAFNGIRDVERFQRLQEEIVGVHVRPALAAAAVYVEAEHPRAARGSRDGGRWIKKGTTTGPQSESEMLVEDETAYARIVAKGEGPPLTSEPPEKGPMAQEILGDAFDTEQLYQDWERFPDTGGYPPDRYERQRLQVEEMLAGKEPPMGQPQMIFMAGGSSSGKSKFVKPLEATIDAVVINPDIIKKGIPEYGDMWDAGDPYAANGVHEESSAVAKMALAEAQRRGLNVIVDGTGDSEPGNFLRKIKIAETNGYRTKVIMVDVPTEVAIQRAHKRANDPTSESYRRVVSEAEIRRVHRSVNARHLEWRDEVDNWEVWDNTGDDPVLVAKRGSQ